MSSICRIGDTVVVTYPVDNQHWQYVVLHPGRKFWGPQYATHSKALKEALTTGLQVSSKPEEEHAATTN